MIEIFTDEGDTVIDPCCGSASTLRASAELNRNSYGFEISKDTYTQAKNVMLRDYFGIHDKVKERKTTEQAQIKFDV